MRARTACWFLLLLVPSAVAARGTGGNAAPVAPAQARTTDATQRIDINNLSMVVTNTGSFAYDKSGSTSGGLEFPKASGKTVVFAGGLWLGALVNGAPRVTVSEYSDDYRPGAILANGQPDDPAKPEYKVYKLDRVYLDGAGAVDVARRDAALADYNAGAVPHGAPPVAVRSDGSLSVVGDEMLWSVFNDDRSGPTPYLSSSALPLGIEVQQLTYAFHHPGALDNTIFIRYRIFNRGTELLSSAYVALWSDPDLGGFTDDLVGCDTTLGVGFAYNASNNDEQYGARAPCVGFDFFQGAKAVPELPGSRGMTSFPRYRKSAEPRDSTEVYLYMQGMTFGGLPMIDPTTGQPTKFFAPGDPVTNEGWLDSFPSDRRLFMSSGPFNMAPGDSQDVVIGIVVGQASNRLTSIGAMKYFDAQVQAFFDGDGAFGSPPSAPVIRATPMDGGVLLSWDASAEQVTASGYPFEGYNLYQSRGPEGPFQRIATFDLDNGIRTVVEKLFDPETGLLLDHVAAFGFDTGLRYSLFITRDTLRAAPLVNGKRYFFAIEGYGVDLAKSPPVMTSARQVIEVVPQPPGGGFLPASVQVSASTPSQRAPGPMPTTDAVVAVVVDTVMVRDATYEVGFKPAGGTTVWYVVRDPAGAADTVANNRSRTAGSPNYYYLPPDEDFPVVDGVQVRIRRYPAGELAAVRYRATGTPALTGFDTGFEFFGGGAGYAYDAFGSTIPRRSTLTHNCELRFTGGPLGQYAYRYLRMFDGGGGRVFLVQDYVPVPFTVWDTDANLQLNAAFLEDAGPPPSANQNGTWDPDDSPSGGREMVWVLDRPYFGDNTPNPAYFTDPMLSDVLHGGLDARYFMWPRATSAGAAPAAGDLLQFLTSVPATANDRFMFTTHAAARNDVASARDALSRVRAVPNPYYLGSSYELTGAERIVKFTHLPVRCTIRLFNLAGDLVRVIEKNDDTSQATWNLESRNGRGVASGIYIFHIEAPGVGTHVGKLAVFTR